jgi:hypothetical protein
MGEQLDQLDMDIWWDGTVVVVAVVAVVVVVGGGGGVGGVGVVFGGVGRASCGDVSYTLVAVARTSML